MKFRKPSLAILLSILAFSFFVSGAIVFVSWRQNSVDAQIIREFKEVKQGIVETRKILREDK